MKTNTIKQLIGDGQRLVSASRSGYAIATYDDGHGPLWIHRDSMGISGIVRSLTWEEAYSICEDEFFPEADETVEQLQSEYGFRREHKKVISCDRGTPIEPHLGVHEKFAEPSDYPMDAGRFIRWHTVETPAPDAWPDNELFQEAYGFRPSGRNSTDRIGHGIYSKDLNGDSLELLTPELASRLLIELVIESEDR